MSKKQTAAPLLLLLTALLVGCGGGTGISNSSGGSNNSGTKNGSLAADASSVNFGNVPIGNPKTDSVILTNNSTSGQSITVSQISTVGTGFSVSSSLALPFTLASGNNTTIGITFSPEKPSTATGTLSVLSDSSAIPLQLPLMGSGLAPGDLTAAPTALNLGTVAVGSTGLGSVVITNVPGGQSVVISEVNVSGSGFSLSSGMSLPITLAAGQTVSIGVAFAPVVGGTASGTLAVVSDANNANLTVNLSGVGAESDQLVASPSPLDLGSVAVGSTVTGTVLLANPGVSSISVSQLNVAGSGFSLASNPALPIVLTYGQSLPLTLAFTPQLAGSATGQLTITSNASNATLPVGLLGAGLAPGQLGVSPTAMNFGNVLVGSSSAQTGLLTGGSAAITVSSANWSGTGFSVTGISFPVTISGGNAVPFIVTFSPTVPGPANGGISFISNASNSPTAATFTGTGTQPVQHSVDLTWNASNSQVVGYNIYRGTTPGGPYPNKLNPSTDPSTNFTDSTVQSGNTYYYVSTSVDAKGRESVYSNAAKAVIP